jgi:hypothetical protein
LLGAPLVDKTAREQKIIPAWSRTMLLSPIMKKPYLTTLLLVSILLILTFPAIGKEVDTSHFTITLPESYRVQISQSTKPIQKTTLLAFDNTFGRSSSLVVDASEKLDVDEELIKESKKIEAQKGSIAEQNCSNECDAYYGYAGKESSSEHVLMVKTNQLNFLIKFITDEGIEKGKAFVFNLAKQINPLEQ